MGFDLTGKLVEVFDTIQRTETFRVRDFVVETSEDIGSRVIVNYVKFQCIQDKTTLPDKFSIGSMVKVHFNIKGSKSQRDGKTNYFTNLDAWRMEEAGLSAGPAAPAPGSDYSDMNNADMPPVDDLPF